MTDFVRSAFAKRGPEHELVGTAVQVGDKTYSVKKVIAQGGYGFIFLVVDGNGRAFALKRIIASGETEKAVKKEVSMLKLVAGHPNIVEFVTAAVLPPQMTKHGNTEFLIIQELCAAPLKAVLEPLLASQQLHHDQRLHVFHKVCEAVAHLHMLKPPVVHRDLKIDNVLLASTGEVKLCDFGSATTTIYEPTLDWSMNQRETATDEIERNTTPIFRSPEMLDLYLNMTIGPKSDIWALGCLLYQLCFGVSPFEESGRLGSLNGKYKLPLDSQFEVFYPLLRGMLTVAVADRWDIQKVLEEVESLAKQLRVDLYNPLPHPLVIPPEANLTESDGAAGQVGDLLAHAGASLSQGGSKLLGFMKGGAGTLMKNIKETSTKVVSTVQGLSQRQVDLGHITSKIAVLGSPSTDVPDAISRNPINEVCEYLEAAHTAQYAVFNLNNRAYDGSRCHGRVVKCGWNPRGSPHLKQLLAFCRSLHKFLSQNPRGLAIIHSEDGKAQSAMAVAAYFVYSGVFKSPSASLVVFGKKRYPNGHRGLVLPSHKRYLDYLAQVLQEERRVCLHCRSIRVKQLVLTCVPKFNLQRSGCKPLVEVVDGNLESWLSADPQQLDRCRSYTDADGAIIVPLEDRQLAGDIKVAMHHIRHLSTLATTTARMFSFHFHTSFIAPDSTEITLKLADIDSINTNLTKFPPSFAAVLHYEVLSDDNESLAVWNKMSMRQTSPKACFDTHEEEQDFQDMFGAMDARASTPAGMAANGRHAAPHGARGSHNGQQQVQEEMEAAANLLALDGDSDEDDDDDDDTSEAVIQNFGAAGAPSNLLGDLDDFSAPAPGARKQPTVPILDFESSSPAPTPTSVPTVDLLGGSPAQQSADPFGGFSDLTSSSAAGAQAPSDPFNTLSASNARTESSPMENMFGASSTSATQSRSSAGSDLGRDLLGGMASDVSFDPFSGGGAPAATSSTSGAPSPVTNTRSMGSGSSSADPMADLMGGMGATHSNGQDLLGGMPASGNLLSGVQSGSAFSRSQPASSSNLMGMGGGGMGSGYGAGGGMRQQMSGPSLSGASSPMYAMSPSMSPQPGSPTGQFSPGGIGMAGNLYGGASGGMGMGMGTQRTSSGGFQSGGGAPTAASGKSADPFAQLSGFGASSGARPANAPSGPATRGAPSNPQNLGSGGMSSQANSRPASKPASGVASPANSGRSTPLGTGPNKGVYTSVIGSREERGTRLGAGAAGLPPKVESSAFTDLLSNQGFQSDNPSGKVSLRNMRDRDLEKTMDPVKLKIMKWTEGKRKNVRALISSLPEVLWEGASWTPVEMHKLVQPNDIKKAYRKACLCVHPDKKTGEPEEELARAIFIELNEAWTAFEQNKDMTRVA